MLLVATLTKTLPYCFPRPFISCKTAILTEVRRLPTLALRLELGRHLEHPLMRTCLGTVAAKTISEFRSVAGRAPECNSILALRAPRSLKVIVEGVAHSARTIGATRSAAIAGIVPARAAVRCEPACHATPTFFIWRHGVLTLWAPNLLCLQCRERRCGSFGHGDAACVFGLFSIGTA